MRSYIKVLSPLSSVTFANFLPLSLTSVTQEVSDGDKKKHTFTLTEVKDSSEFEVVLHNPTKKEHYVQENRRKQT